MVNDKSGPVVIGERVAIKRAHQYACANCPRWEQVKQDQGVCRLRRPTQAIVGMGEDLARSPRPVTMAIYDMTMAHDVCALHPELLRTEIVTVLRSIFHAWDNRLTWTREAGFNRAPSATEARNFAVDDDKT